MRHRGVQLCTLGLTTALLVVTVVWPPDASPRRDACTPDGTPHPIYTPGVDRSERGNTTYTHRHDVSGRTPNTCVTHPFVCCPRYRECPEPAEACWYIAYVTDTFTGCVPP